jgi:hypothetical protein
MREVLRHMLVFDESHNVFPRDQYGEHSVPSRLAREVREYGEGIIAATQQADVSESLIANSGTKIILRTDYPKDVDFASKLLQVKSEWLSRLPLGIGIIRLPTRYYQPFLFTFPEQPQKNAMITDDVVSARFDQKGMTRPSAQITDKEKKLKESVSISEQEHALLNDIAIHPIAGITARYERLGWHPKTGNKIKDTIINKRLAEFEEVPTRTARIKILFLTSNGLQYLNEHGISIIESRRGGAAHEYWRTIIRDILERNGYAVTEEYPIGGGRTVDVHATKGEHEITVEIETGRSNISANINKCANLPGTILFFFATPELEQKWRTSLLPEMLGKNPGTIDDLPTILQ